MKHVELLKRSRDLEKHGKSLYHENQEDHLELLKYGAAVENYIFWKKKDQFVLLIENFINGIIDAEEFSDTLYVLHSKTLDTVESFETKVEKLKDFHPDPDFISERFSSFVAFLCRQSEDFEDYYTEEELRDFVRNAMLQIQEYL